MAYEIDLQISEERVALYNRLHEDVDRFSDYIKTYHALIEREEELLKHQASLQSNRDVALADAIQLKLRHS